MEFTEVCSKIWASSKHTELQNEEFKTLQILQNCEYMKTPYLKLEIYSKLNEAAPNKDKSAQRRKRMSDKATIPVM